MIHFHVITLFKDAVDSYVNESILGRAKGEGKIKVSYYDPRKYSGKKDSAGKTAAYIDGKPYGGGPGMVLQALPFLKAAEAAQKKAKKTKVLIFSPSGTQFTNEYAAKLAKNYTDVILIAGRYEGIDARVKKILKAEEISVGPYVLTGGEIPAAIVIDAVARQTKGVLGNFDSREEERIAGSEIYTRPEVFEYKGKKHSVPKVFLSGDPKKINEWRSEMIERSPKQSGGKRGK